MMLHPLNPLTVKYQGLDISSFHELSSVLMDFYSHFSSSSQLVDLWQGVFFHSEGL